MNPMAIVSLNSIFNSPLWIFWKFSGIARLKTHGFLFNLGIGLNFWPTYGIFATSYLIDMWNWKKKPMGVFLWFFQKLRYRNLFPLLFQFHHPCMCIVDHKYTPLLYKGGIETKAQNQLVYLTLISMTAIHYKLYENLKNYWNVVKF